ncbi:MAG: phosphoglycerate dehydrogenase [Defluviitaleaceae bacterium]|nr:phosphoglycerate dehydrogenase [Defluviitaleaceae bacterium]
MKRILATPRSFAKEDKSPLHLLNDAGYTVALNPVGQIMTKAQMIEHLKGCVGVIVGVDPMDEEVITSAAELKAISKYGVGTDNIDLEAAKRRGIPVSITAGANSNAVADYAFALMMTIARRIIPIDKACHSRDWSKQTSLDIYGATLGLLGLGAVGKGVAIRASAGFGMKVLAYDPCWDEDFASRYGIHRATPEEIYSHCDFISLHLPLTEQTGKMIGASQFAMMKPTAILINTSRGGIIDDSALVDALSSKLIYGAGIDAFEHEPPLNQALYELDNLVMGSHTAASTIGAVNNMGLIAAKNILRELS